MLGETGMSLRNSTFGCVQSAAEGCASLHKARDALKEQEIIWPKTLIKSITKPHFFALCCAPVKIHSRAQNSIFPQKTAG